MRYTDSHFTYLLTYLFTIAQLTRLALFSLVLASGAVNQLIVNKSIISVSV